MKACYSICFIFNGPIKAITYSCICVIFETTLALSFIPIKGMSFLLAVYIKKFGSFTTDLVIRPSHQLINNGLNKKNLYRSVAQAVGTLFKFVQDGIHKRGCISRNPVALNGGNFHLLYSKPEITWELHGNNIKLCLLSTECSPKICFSLSWWIKLGTRVTTPILTIFLWTKYPIYLIIST